MNYPASLYASTALSPETTYVLLFVSVCLLISGILLIRRRSPRTVARSYFNPSVESAIQEAA